MFHLYSPYSFPTYPNSLDSFSLTPTLKPKPYRTYHVLDSGFLFSMILYTILKNKRDNACKELSTCLVCNTQNKIYYFIVSLPYSGFE